MKRLLSLLLFGIVTMMASCSGTASDSPQKVAISFMNAMRKQNLSLIKETSTKRVSTSLSKYFASATERNIKELSSFNTTYESDKKVGNIYFERFLYGDQKKDTMVLKLIKETGQWKVVGVTWKPFKN